MYGSRAKGNYHPGSDIDLVIMDDLIKDSRLNNLEIDLDDLLLPYKLDLTVFQKIQNQDLIDHINRVGILFYTKYSRIQ
nr:nucleotidyltransferase domain-containing protein [uncultured Desulfobacter sp.]